jgi:molecular chaperone IbpA
MTMRSYDFAPLYRATVGFDRVANLMDRALSADLSQPTYPPYNIEKTANDAYRISVAVAGFTADELGVEVKDGHLTVTARKGPDAEERAFLHRGIANRAFERRFALADHVRVAGASHDLGMLHMDLVVETPEALKPRRIEIARPGDIEVKAVASDTVETATH